jgi:hypothetical protein
VNNTAVLYHIHRDLYSLLHKERISNGRKRSNLHKENTTISTKERRKVKKEKRKEERIEEREREKDKGKVNPVLNHIVAQRPPNDQRLQPLLCNRRKNTRF